RTQHGDRTNNSTILPGVPPSLAPVPGGLAVRSGAPNPVPAAPPPPPVPVPRPGSPVRLDPDSLAMIPPAVHAGAMAAPSSPAAMMRTFRREGREHEVAPRHTEPVVGPLSPSHLRPVLEHSPRPPTPSAYPIGEHRGHVTSATHSDTSGTLPHTHVPPSSIGSGPIPPAAPPGATAPTVHTPGD
ncbi:vegetative cell wall protein gp1-like, partial [Selaginella moellendorffii]|uniref:vegetative cell wall protein gp1-like n=1 Tax=Selaginella moellendorffii TaxID=88036 RepID=UPI000D1C5153